MTHLAAALAGSFAGAFVFAIIAVHVIDRADARGDVHHSRRPYRLNRKTGGAK